MKTKAQPQVGTGTVKDECEGTGAVTGACEGNFTVTGACEVIHVVVTGAYAKAQAQ